MIMIDYFRVCPNLIDYHCIRDVNAKVTQVTSIANTQTHVRATKTAARRIEKLAKRLAKSVGGTWGQATVVDKALDTLEEKLANPTELKAA